MSACELYSEIPNAGKVCFSPSNGGYKRRKTGDLTPDDVENHTHPAQRQPFVFAGEPSDKYDFLNDQPTSAHAICTHGQPLLDEINYSQAWYLHYRRREPHFKPWSPALGPASGTWDALRVTAIGNYWRTIKSNRISPITVHLGVWIMNKLLAGHLARNTCFDREAFAGIVAVAFRTALKFEERPESLWSIRRIWDVLPMFESWNFDRSDAFLMKIESDSLRLLNDCLDVPLSVQFFDKFISVGGWPVELAKDYAALGHFLLGLATFSSGNHHPLIDVCPSKLAAAAVVLSVKIVNGDSRRSYEFYPERFAAFCQLPLKELQPAIKGLSMMLRKKPEEAAVLAKVYPEWGDHEWQ